MLQMRSTPSQADTTNSEAVAPASARGPRRPFSFAEPVVRRSSVAVPTGEQEALDGSVPLKFDRRREPRRRTDGWAQVLCLDPYKTFLGGPMELREVSAGGMALIADHPIPVGEAIEVRLAPFKVRGRLGLVANCQPIPAAADVSLPDRRRYRIGIRFPRATLAA